MTERGTSGESHLVAAGTVRQTRYRGFRGPWEWACDCGRTGRAEDPQGAHAGLSGHFRQAHPLPGESKDPVRARGAEGRVPRVQITDISVSPRRSHFLVECECGWFSSSPTRVDTVATLVRVHMEGHREAMNR